MADYAPEPLIPASLEVREGKVYFAKKPLDLGSLVFDAEIARGANGVVFRAFDPDLERQVAVKIWFKIRDGDPRDKAAQGLAESRKTWTAQHDQVARLFFAGHVEGLFFTVMELVNGRTLKDWIRDETPSLGARCYAAERIIDLDSELQKRHVVHGDLHWNNIMVIEDVSPRPYTDLTSHRRWNLKLLDFGTSAFSGKPASRARHYCLLEELVNKCIAPLSVAHIAASPRPADLDVTEMGKWLHRTIFAVRVALFEMGYEFVGWPLYRSFGTYEFKTKGFGLDPRQAYVRLSQLIQSGVLRDSKDSLGDAPEWGPFDGRTAKRED